MFVTPSNIAGQICFDGAILKRVKFTDLKDDYEAGDIIFDKRCVVSKVFGKHDYLVCYKGVIMTYIDKLQPNIACALSQSFDNPKHVVWENYIVNMCGFAMSDITKGTKPLIAMLICFGGARPEESSEKKEKRNE